MRLPRVTVTMGCAPLRDKAHWHPVTGLAGGQDRLQAGDRCGRLASYAQHDVTGRDARLGGRAARRHGNHADPGRCPLASATLSAVMPSQARPDLVTVPGAMSCPASHPRSVNENGRCVAGGSITCSDVYTGRPGHREWAYRGRASL